MDQRSIEDLLALITAGNVTRAARLRHVSQSAYSRRLQSIESDLGVSLFDRSTRAATVSPSLIAMRTELETAQVLLKRLALDLSQASRRAPAPVELGIAAVHGLASRLLPLAASSITADGVHVRVRSANRDACFVRLMTEEVFAVAVYETRANRLNAPSDLVDHQMIGTDVLVPVCAADRGAEIESLLSAGEPVPLVSYPVETFMGSVIGADIVHGSAHAFRPALTAGSTDVVRSAALAGMGMAWLPLSSAAIEVRAGSLRLLDVATLPRLPLDVSLLRLKVRGADELSGSLQHLTAGIARGLDAARTLLTDR